MPWMVNWQGGLNDDLGCRWNQKRAYARSARLGRVSCDLVTH